MTESVTSFDVRAHHAQQLWRMEYLGYSPEALAKDLKHSGENLLAKIANPGHHHDVFGTTATENEAAVAGLTTFFRSYKNLSPGDPVTFTALGKDGICGSCTVGNHCDIIRPRFDGDAEWIRGLRDTAAELGLMSNIKIGKTTVKSLFSKEVETTLTTDAATSKKIVGDRLLPMRAVALPIDRYMARLSIKRQERMSNRIG